MMARVFISYRRNDSKYQARMIYGAFQNVLPRGCLFMDIDSIPPGVDFVETLQGWVNQCDIMLALIGPGWIEATDPKTGHRRLDDPNDFVRVEIREALARSIPVVPMLLDGASMPDTERLPEDMKGLVRRQAEFVEYRTFDADVGRLIQALGLGDGVGPVTFAAGSAGSSRRQPEEDSRGVEESAGGQSLAAVEPVSVNETGRILTTGSVINRLRDFIYQKRNRVVLGWLGGGLAFAATVLWVAFVYFFPPQKSAEPRPTDVQANCGGVAVGGNVTGTTITTGTTTNSDCWTKSK
jgi:TIR domain